MKVEGFTLLEMMMVLALTALVLAIAWGAYSSFYLFGREYEKRHHDLGEWQLADRALTLDAQRCKKVLLSRDSLVLYTPEACLYHRFTAGLVREKKDHRDSFFIPLESWELIPLPGKQQLKLHLTTGNNAYYDIDRRATARSPVLE